MPVSRKIYCPQCQVRLWRKPGGRCPACGANVTAHVSSERAHEERAEKIVAVVATALVIAVSLFTFGAGIVEGVLAYAGAGAVVWFLARRTF